MENLPPNRGMWNQEYSHGRISQNFRSTKPLLDRKRPLENAPNSSNQRMKESSMGTESLPPLTNFNRTPLMELSTNTPYKRLKPAFESYADGYPCGLTTPPPRFDLDKEIINGFQTEISGDDGFSSEAFVTPLKEPERVTLSYGCSTSSSLLDDDIDDSILEEIDLICEQSARKAVCQTPSTSINQTPSKDNKSSDLKASLDFRDVKKFEPDSNVKVKLDEETTIAADLALLNSMPDECSKYIMSLNDRQRDAACSNISTPLMVIAGPGSGKTSTMVGRVLVLLNEGLLPSNILAMTFTTAATSEMRERIGKSAGKKAAKDITISTFHSFSLQLCRMHADKLQRTSEFSVYGHGQQRRAIIEAVRLYEEEKKNGSKTSVACESGEDLNGAAAGAVCPQYAKDLSKKWQKFVTQGKASGKTPEQCRKMGNEIGAKILGNYNDILKACDALDYHDLISCSVTLLSDFPEVFKECQDTWKAIIVDEFQDTSTMQYKLLRMLGSHNHITIVGDDDQSIFGFNGADSSGFDSFRRDFPNYKEVRLIKNYRSSRHIVEAASSIIKNNTKRCQSKSISSENSQGSKAS
ncbi:unnamed protein product [Arabidopsis halleri]